MKAFRGEPGPQGDCQVVRRLEFRDLLLEEKLYQPKSSLPLHVHRDAFFCMAVEGGWTETHGQTTRRYSAMDTQYMPPNQEHSMVFERRARSFGLYLKNETWLRATHYGFRLNEAVQSHRGAMMALLSKVYAELCPNDMASYFAIQGLTAELLAHTMRKTAVRGEQRPVWLDRARELVREQFAEPLSLYDVANELQVHPAHLARMFRRHFGKTMGEYIREVRIRHSMVALASGEASIVEVAMAAGFADQSHFCRVFKEHLGQTPREYRMMFQRS